MPTDQIKKDLKKALTQVKTECNSRLNGDPHNAFLQISISISDFIMRIDAYDLSSFSNDALSKLMTLIKNVIFAFESGSDKDVLDALNDLIDKLDAMFPSIT